MALGKPKLLGSTPDDVDFNALLEEGLHDELLRAYSDPAASDRRVAIVVLETVKFTDEKGKGRQANLRVQHIELPTDGNLEAVEELLISAFRKRTKKQGFPGESASQGTPLDLSGLDEHTTPTDEQKAADDAAFDDAAPEKDGGTEAPVTPIR